MTTLPEEAVLALTAAIPFLPVQAAVKKLAWIRPPLSDTLSRCDTDFGTYRTWTHDEANGKWFWSVEGGCNEANGEAPNEEAAQAAAQADYEAPILSVIENGIAVSGPSCAKIKAARKAVEELTNTQMNMPLEDWSRISSTIFSALEPRRIAKP
ncbi:hypothetical protein WH297_03935 [Ochrobactrum vermis]|uniref:Uncharacterized protein n=1 Tax=Ochrobactrum vermis TaxID=1827297 RepID=A0ABU8P9F9_9HYPH|nr:hypothetical protein [Ochrobactrum vermis]PQZ29430.1 hypothetical protein CQZ93_04010 [Ochrobactrum vermis]